MNCKLFVCMHKVFDVPSSEEIRPIFSGYAPENLSKNIERSDIADNIADKNPFFSELTATYWIWKNVDAEVVGLMHYRRFFNFADDEKKFYKFSPNFLQKYGITAQNIQKTLENHDIILPQLSPDIKTSVYEFYKKYHFIKDLDVALEIIKEKYPEAFETANNFIKNNSRMYPVNMLICRKKLFDEYAAWVFPILFELEKRQHDEAVKRDAYQQRLCGYVGERLLGIFVALHPELKVKELPILFHETNIFKYLKYRLRMAKRSVLSAIGFKKDNW